MRDLTPASLERRPPLHDPRTRGTSDFNSVEIGNLPDAPQLVPDIVQIMTSCGRPPDQVTADRGYGKATVDKGLGDLGVAFVAIPRPEKPSQ
jgi:IS5 family transposase